MRKRWRPRALVLALLGLAACGGRLNDDGSEPAPPRAGARLGPTIDMLERAMIGEIDAALAASGSGAKRARGLGTLTARVPGTSAVTEGVRLAARRVRVKIEGDFARTEIEEEFFNETDRVLEGRYVFPLPPSASISRLALWVGEDLVEGEILEASRAAGIFAGIVDDTVRPRDPALLEWTHHREFSLKIFPLPAKGRRKVLVAYDEALSTAYGETRYTLPLGLGAARAVPIDEFSLDVEGRHTQGSFVYGGAEGLDVDLKYDKDNNLSIHHTARAFVPPDQFVIRWTSGPDDQVMVHAPKGGAGERFFAASVTVRPSGEAASQRPARDRVLVLDAGAGGTPESFAEAVTIAESIAGRLAPEERFAVLVCDSACASYPAQGLAAPGEEAFASLRSFLREQAPGGSSDLAGALSSAAERLDAARGGQVVYLGDGGPTAGELGAASIAARVAPALSAKRAELRLFGLGRSLDELTLSELAARLGASYDALATDAAPAYRIAKLIGGLRIPLVTGAKLELPPGFVEEHPRALPALQVGQKLFVVGKLAGEAAQGTITLRGAVAGEAVEMRVPITPEITSPLELPFLPRLWAEARIASLEGAGDPASIPEIVALSQRHHVMSRHTSLLVLENDRMFAAYGIPRTQGAGAAGGVSGARAENSPAEALPPVRGTGDGAGGFGYGGSIGRLSGEHLVHVPRIRTMPVTVDGRFPVEVVQRIVRQQYGRFRLCYEKALLRKPDLSGRITVRFVIERDGSVSNPSRGPSTINDDEFANCIVRAFSGLAFPQPDGGKLIVTYPMTFEPPSDKADPAPRGPRPVQEGPRARHAEGDEQWRSEGEADLAKLKSALDAEPSSRKRHEAYVKALLARGRASEALAAAKRFSELDPDSARALELYAQAAAFNGEIRAALRAIDALAAMSPRNAVAHHRAARAFEAAGDERRACAHWRSLGELLPRSEEARYEALRCRARVLGERDAVRAELARINDKAKPMEELAAALEKGEAPAYAPAAGAAGLEVRLSCSEAADKCPKLALLAPDGVVHSPVTPGRGASSGAGWIALPSPAAGVYRTIVAGGAPGVRASLELRAYGAVKKIDLPSGEGIRTAAVTTVEILEMGFGRGS